MLTRVAFVATLGLALSGGVAFSSGGVTYTGGSPKASHVMQIYLYLQPDHRAQWDIDIRGPCSQGSELGRAIGTGTSVHEPLLHLRLGRFRLQRSNTVQTTDIHYSYTLTGKRVTGGFAGTLRYVEHVGIGLPNPGTCDSTLLHWTARRGGIFR
jgi:hypothetical protein